MHKAEGNIYSSETDSSWFWKSRTWTMFWQGPRETIYSEQWLSENRTLIQLSLLFKYPHYVICLFYWQNKVVSRLYCILYDLKRFVYKFLIRCMYEILPKQENHSKFRVDNLQAILSYRYQWGQKQSCWSLLSWQWFV